MYTALDKCVMPALLRCLNRRPCHCDDTGMSTRNNSPSLSATYSRYNECTFGPRASKRFPLCSVHPPDGKPTWMLSLPNCPTEISGRESSSTCRTLRSTNVEPPARLSSTVSIPIMSQCCEFPTRTELECQVVYCRN